MKKTLFCKQVTALIFLAVVLSARIAAQEFPEKPIPPRLVNDFAGMLSDQEVYSLRYWCSSKVALTVKG